MRIFHLYRPRLPSLRAQAIQVLHACHAFAARGHRVTLLADRGDLPATPAAALAAFGLDPLPGLDLRICPTANPALSGLWFRVNLSAWWMGAPGLVIARDKRRLAAALRWLTPRRHRVALETHELDSALAEERGEDSASIHELERWLLKRVDALVANCGGTLEMWEERHGERLPARRGACHNATAPGRRREARPGSATIRCLGSLRSYKGFDTALAAAPDLPLPLELIGGSPAEQAAFGPLPANLRARDPVPYPAVPDLLADSRALLLPLADNLFGRRLTSPLKLWDYLATAAPVIAPDLPSIREIAALTGADLHLYRPGDPGSLVAAARRAVAAPPRAPHLRTWQDRAAEFEAIVGAPR